MQSIINFFRGHVQLRVEGAFPERFLNLCAQRGLPFWDLTWVDAHALTLRCVKGQLPHAQELAQRVQCQITPVSRTGFPFFLRQFRRRYALLAGMVLSLATVCVLSQFVLTIEVSGNETVSTADILSQLRQQGVTVGVYGPNLALRQISQEALLGLPELAWMSINLHGTRAEVLVREALPKPPLREEDTPAHVVAETTGIISKVELLDGQALFQEGQTVLEGEIVISGVMDLKEPLYGTVDAGQRIVHGRGRIYAQTWRTLTAAIPLSAQVKTYTGEEKRGLGMTILGQTVNFYGNGGISIGKYDKIKKSTPVSLPGVGVFPVVLHQTWYRGYETQSQTLDEAAAENLLKTHLMARLESAIGADGVVEHHSFSAVKEDGLLRLTLVAQCQEEIGREVTFPGTVGMVEGKQEETT